MHESEIYTKLVDTLSELYFGPFWREADHMNRDQRRKIWALAHEINHKMRQIKPLETGIQLNGHKDF